jgi:hypothetical protein
MACLRDEAPEFILVLQLGLSADIGRTWLNSIQILMLTELAQHSMRVIKHLN